MMSITAGQGGDEEQKPCRQSCCDVLKRGAHWKCLLLTALLTSCIVAICWCRLTEITKLHLNFDSFPITSTHRMSPCEDGYVYIPITFMVMLYLLYLVECWHSTTRAELTHKTEVSLAYDHIQKMRTAQPVIWWKAVCYHYVRRTRQVTRYRNGDAYTTTQVYYERINSHAAGSCFVFTHCGIKDISKHLINLENYPATRIKFTKGFAFANLEAANEFEEQRARFFQENERYDDYMEMREGLDLTNVNFKEYMVAFADPENLPWYANQCVFWLFSFLLLSWPLRLVFEFNTANIHYQVTKLFGTNYASPESCGGELSRRSTADSSDIEYTIRNNFSLVPSYSEALLMDTAALEQNNNTTETLPSISLAQPTSSNNYNRRSWGPISTAPHLDNRIHQTVYLANPLVARTPEDPFQGRQRTTPTENPPDYETALTVSIPIKCLIRRSFTDRDFFKRFLPDRRRSLGTNITHL